MKKENVYLLGGVMAVLGVLSTLHFTLTFQQVFQAHLAQYGKLFDRGLVGRCLYMDVIMFLYIASFLFKNLYYVLGGILLLCFIEFGRELGLLASFISLVTEASFRLMHMGPGAPLRTQVSISGFFLFVMSIAIPLIFIYCLTRKTMVEQFKRRAS